MTANFLLYATANDAGGYLRDTRNFERLAQRDPGVGEIEVVVAVSEVQPASRLDRRWYRMLADRLQANPAYRVREIVFKPNVGRDFSSWQHALNVLDNIGDDGDPVFLVNRSAYGPLEDGWYARFSRHFERYPNTGLCGNSINFELNDIVDNGANTHVQSYALMSRLGVLRQLLDDFPGRLADSRLEAIRDGEVGLSRRLLGMGYGLSCLWWPQHVFTAKTPHDPSLEQDNPAPRLKGLPYRHWESRDKWRARMAPAQYLQRTLYWLSSW